MLYKVNVTRKIINRSRGNDGTRCMVYNALRPIIRKDLKFVVGILDFSAAEYIIPLPTSIHESLCNHYDGKVVEPFSFEIDLPEELTNEDGSHHNQSEGD